MKTLPRTQPCLWFDHQAEEAARFYVSVFPNSRIGAITHYGPRASLPEGTVLTIDFELDGQHHTALNGGPHFSFTEAISLQIDCADQAEVDAEIERFEKLVDDQFVAVGARSAPI